MNWIDLHSFTVPLVPRPKGRHRTGINKSTGRPIQFTDKKTRQAESDLLTLALAQKPQEPHQGALGIDVTAYLPIPSSWSKKKQESAFNAVLRPVTRPDGDNLLKLVCDALSGVFWKNDTQLVKKTISKFYCKSPRWIIRIQAWGGTRKG
jgi:Holliday junction resolvase RusA-like endonuclease